MSARDRLDEVEVVPRLGAILDAAVPGLGRMDRLRRRFPDWRIWRTTSGPRTWHARRNDPSGRFEASAYSPRRYAVCAKSPGVLALMLAAQRRIDGGARWPR